MFSNANMLEEVGQSIFADNEKVTWKALISSERTSLGKRFGQKYKVREWKKPIFSNVNSKIVFSGMLSTETCIKLQTIEALQCIAEADYNADAVIHNLMCCTTGLSKWCKQMCKNRSSVKFSCKCTDSKYRIDFPPSWWQCNNSIGVDLCRTQRYRRGHIIDQIVSVRKERNATILEATNSSCTIRWQLGLAIKSKYQFTKTLKEWAILKCHSSRIHKRSIASLARLEIVKQICECVIKQTDKFDLKDIVAYNTVQNKNIKMTFHSLIGLIGGPDCSVHLCRQTPHKNKSWTKSSGVYVMQQYTDLIFISHGGCNINVDATEQLMVAANKAEFVSNKINYVHMENTQMSAKECLASMLLKDKENIEIAIRRFAEKYNTAFGNVKHEDIDNQILGISKGALWECGFGAFRDWWQLLHRVQDTLSYNRDGIIGVLCNMTQKAFADLSNTPRRLVAPGLDILYETSYDPYRTLN